MTSTSASSSDLPSKALVSVLECRHPLSVVADLFGRASGLGDDLVAPVVDAGADERPSQHLRRIRLHARVQRLDLGVIKMPAPHTRHDKALATCEASDPKVLRLDQRVERLRNLVPCAFLDLIG